MSIELMLVLSVMAIFGGITLYVGKRCIDRAKLMAADVDAQTFIMKLLEYYGATKEWPISTENWVSLQAVNLQINKAFDEVLWDNPYSFKRGKNRKKFPIIWLRVGACEGLNRWGETMLEELRRRTQRNVLESEIKNVESVRYFSPQKDDRGWIQSVEEHIKAENPDLEPVLG